MTSRNFLSKHFQAVYDRLEADALLYNRELPHHGLVGALNEDAIAEVVRGFLPRRFGVEVNALVIDHTGETSRQCDIVIYDDEAVPKYFRKVFPVERVYAVIEVKTTLTSQRVAEAIEVLGSVSRLHFRPKLVPYWESRSHHHYHRFLTLHEDYTGTVLPKIAASNASEGLRSLHYQDPPMLIMFGYRSEVASFEAFCRWIPPSMTYDGVRVVDPEVREFLVCCLDQGIIHWSTGDGHVRRYFAAASASRGDRGIQKRVFEQEMAVDPAKSLLLFLEQLWVSLERHRLHPGFDIRTYMNDEMNAVLALEHEHVWPLGSK